MEPCEVPRVQVRVARRRPLARARSLGDRRARARSRFSLKGTELTGDETMEKLGMVYEGYNERKYEDAPPEEEAPMIDCEVVMDNHMPGKKQGIIKQPGPHMMVFWVDG